LEIHIKNYIKSKKCKKNNYKSRINNCKPLLNNINQNKWFKNLNSFYKINRISCKNVKSMSCIMLIKIFKIIIQNNLKRKFKCKINTIKKTKIVLESSIKMDRLKIAEITTVILKFLIL